MNEINGTNGDDTLDSLPGEDDTLNGAYGNDTFLFSLGDGQDTITDWGGIDRVVFDNTVSAASVSYVQNGYDLQIFYGTGTDAVTVANFFYPSEDPDNSNLVETVEFSDATIHNAAYISSHLGPMPDLPLTDVYGTSGDDILQNGLGGGLLTGYEGNDYYIVNNPDDVVVENPDEGYDYVQSSVSYALPDNVEALILSGDNSDKIATGNDQDNYIVATGIGGTTVLDGRGGNDNLSGWFSDDTLIGGTGDDNLSGSYLNDTYIFSLGDGLDNINDWDGVDRIVFDSSVSTSSVIYQLSGWDLVITYGTSDQITVTSFFVPPDYGMPGVVETVEYTDGTVHDMSYITAHLGPHEDVFGTEGDDYLYSYPVGYGLMVGYTGDDAYSVDSPSDVVIENPGEGYDTVYSYISSYALADNVEVLYLAGIDVMTYSSIGQTGIGNDLDNVMTAASSMNNTLDGGGGNDYLTASYGSHGTNTYIGGTGTDTMDGGFGDSTFLFRQGDGQDGVVDSEGADRIVFDTTVSADSVVYADAGNGSDIFIYYGDGADMITVTGFFYGQYKIETVEFSDGTVHDANYIMAQVITLDVFGTSGDDFIDNGVVGGQLVGYEGNDTYVVNYGGDVVTENPGEGLDTVQSTISHTLTDNVENLYLTGASSASTGTGNGQDNEMFGQDGFASVLDGRGGDDALHGGAGDNTLIGGIGNDSLQGGSGNNAYLFTAGDGQDLISETSGTDRIVFDATVLSSSATYQEKGDDLILHYGADQVTIDGFFAGADTVETVEFSDGTVHDVTYIMDNISTRDVFGTSGDDILDNGPGDGTMTGYDGNDEYIVNNSSDVVAENPDEGYDSIRASTSFTMPDNVEAMYMFGPVEGITGTGNDQSNFIWGNTGSVVSTLDGRGGDDTLVSAGDSDTTMIGGAGDDVLGGAYGNDTYIVNHPGDVVVENANGGDDDVQSTIDYTLPDNVEYLYLTGFAESNAGVGNDLKNQIFGQQGGIGSTLDGAGGNDGLFAGNGLGADTLIGGTGDDGLNGGYGDDTYFFRAGDGHDRIVETMDIDRILFDASVSQSTVTYARSGWDLIIDYGNGDQITVATVFRPQFDPNDPNEPRYMVETLEFTNGTVVNLANIVAQMGDPLPPVAQNDAFATFYGQAISGNVLADNGYGEDSDPNLDALTVTTNSVISSSGVQVSISSSGDFSYAPAEDFLGTDTFTYTVSDGSSADSATVTINVAAPAGSIIGTAAGEAIGGTMQADSILALGGNDTVNAAGGADTVHAGSGNDVLNGADGNDAMYGESGDDTLNGQSGNDILSGGSGNDVLNGNDGVDVLDGGDGDDSLSGQAGNDTLSGDNGNDILTGLGGVDVLNGGSGNDSLSGGDGNDTLSGGDGVDNLWGNAAADIFRFDAATAYNNIDAIKDFSKAQGDKIDIHELLTSYDPMTNALADFVQISTDGSNSALLVDRDGAGTSFSWTQVATIEGVTGLTDEAALVASGHLIVT